MVGNPLLQVIAISEVIERGDLYQLGLTGGVDLSVYIAPRLALYDTNSVIMPIFIILLLYHIIFI